MKERVLPVLETQIPLLFLPAPNSYRWTVRDSCSLASMAGQCRGSTAMSQHLASMARQDGTASDDKDSQGGRTIPVPLLSQHLGLGPLFASPSYATASLFICNRLPIQLQQLS